MSDRNTLEWLVAKMTALEKVVKDINDPRMDAFTDLLMSLETRLAEMMDQPRDMQPAVIEPVNNFSPTVNVSPTPIKVNVQPTPITMECSIPKFDIPPAQVVFQERERALGKWKISMMTHNGPREITMEQLA